MKTINLNSLDKSNWKSFRFDEIAKNVSERVDPTSTDLKVYIGLEHVDAETVHIKRTGTPDQVKGQKLKGYPGDIIFGKRRAYQRKAAILTEESVCSAHAFILRANPEVIDPQLFPFFLHSDLFMHQMVDISVGGLSPTINWGILKSQEFLLPPKEQQAELAELLWAMDEVIEKELAVLEKLSISRELIFKGLVEDSQGKMSPLSKILVPKKCKSAIPHQRKKYIGLEHITSGSFNCTEYGNTEDVQAQCNIVDTGDLCYSKLRPYLDKAFIASFDAVSTTELLVYNTKDVSKEYLLYHLHSKPFIDYVSGKGFGTKMPRVSHKIIGEYQIKIVKNETDILNNMKKIMLADYQLKEKLSSSKALQKSLINQVF